MAADAGRPALPAPAFFHRAELKGDVIAANRSPSLSSPVINMLGPVQTGRWAGEGHS